jgi:hypothetical protein
MSKQEFEARISLENYEHISVSDHEEGLYLSVWKLGAYAAVPIPREKVIELRDALNKFLSQE